MARCAPRGAVSTFCAEHGISRKSFYELRKRTKVDGPAAVLELEDAAARRRVLETAVPRGLLEFAEIVPSLSDVYREVTR